MGNIYFFHKKDPEKAQEYYEKAAKYAAPHSSYHTSLAFLHIGLIRALQDDFQGAYQSTSKAIELSPELCEAHYQHAQYCAQFCKRNEAIKHLWQAIQVDRYYCLKANSEKNFGPIRKYLQIFFEKLRKDAKAQAINEINQVHKLILEAKSQGLSDYDKSSEATQKFKAAIKKKDEAKELLGRASLFDYWDTEYEARVAQDMVLSALEICFSEQIEEVKRKQNHKVKQLRERAEYWAMMPIGIFGTIIILIIIVVSAYFVATEILPRTNTGFEAVFMGIFSFIMMCVIGAVIASIPAVINAVVLYAISIFISMGICDLVIKKHKPQYERKLAKLQANLNKVQHKRAQLRDKEKINTVYQTVPQGRGSGGSHFQEENESEEVKNKKEGSEKTSNPTQNPVQSFWREKKPMEKHHQWKQRKQREQRKRKK